MAVLLSAAGVPKERQAECSGWKAAEKFRYVLKRSLLIQGLWYECLFPRLLVLVGGGGSTGGLGLLLALLSLQDELDILDDGLTGLLRDT